MNPELELLVSAYNPVCFSPFGNQQQTYLGTVPWKVLPLYGQWLSGDCGCRLPGIGWQGVEFRARMTPAQSGRNQQNPNKAWSSGVDGIDFFSRTAI
jgi:hypothetical protein